MAEIATVARPYAEALFQVASKSDAAAWLPQVHALASVSADETLRQFADHPKTTAAQVIDVIGAVVGKVLGGAALNTGMQNFLAALVDNGRLAAMPEIAAQFQALVNKATGVAHADIYSAYEMTDAQVAGLLPALERRFGKKLTATVLLEPELLGGIRVVVGDEVLDTSVKAKLQSMQGAMSA